jgi:energy-coupling factor transport system permease protein
MRSPLAYVHRPGPLGDAGPLAASAFLGSFAVIAFAYSNPIVLAGAAAAVACAGLAAGARRALALSARWGLSLGAVLVVINGLTSQRGDTILVHGVWLPLLGQIDVSGEALVEGAVLALRILVVMMAFSVHAACVDPDRMLRLFRPLARRSALTATLIVRMVPLAAADHARLAEAAALRGPAAAPVGRAALARRLVAGSLDRAVDAAATLELRGYERDAPRSRGPRVPSRHDPILLATACVVIAAAIAGRLVGVGGFDAYPTLALDAGPATMALAAALPLAALVPFGADRV